MSDGAASEIVVAGARALAHTDGLEPGLRVLLGAVVEQLGIESAAIFVVSERPGRLELGATFGLGDPAIAGLVAAVGNPGHPIARTLAAPVPTFDVLPTAPGGPALRSHLPLIVTRDGSDVVLGVLALAHEGSIAPAMRPLVQAVADFAAVAVERSRVP